MRYLLLFSFFANLSLILAVKAKVTDKAILDIEIQGKHVGEIEIGLFRKVVPKTVENFVELCKRPHGKGYKGSRFVMIERDFWMHGGYFEMYGREGRNIYGSDLERENFKLLHYGAGWVSMVNNENLKSNIKFSICFRKLDVCDLVNVVFGKIIKGMRVARFINRTSVFDDYEPMKNITIANCTVEVVKKPFVVKKAGAIE